MNSKLVQPSKTISFADIAHQTLLFDAKRESERLILELIDTKWMQRLRTISQTGNTRLVYMFAEHSRFGHSLGVAYLATLLMRHLREYSAESIRPYENAVAAAALLHDIGHVAPGSHLGERVWSEDVSGRHEDLSVRIILENEEIHSILASYDPALPRAVCDILEDKESVPPWTRSVISGGGWNADRGNWAIVDSAMCCVSYGRYNVLALIDAFRLTESGQLVLLESRLDALTHFFVARDSMYRQVYQHRVLQATDALTLNIVRRIRALQKQCSSLEEVAEKYGIHMDETMRQVLGSAHYVDTSLDTVFEMNEHWWSYHLHRWCAANDAILSDLSTRLRDRVLFKTIRLESDRSSRSKSNEKQKEFDFIFQQAKEICEELGLDPEYYLTLIEEKDKHRGKTEAPPLALLETGEVLPVTEVEPMIEQIMKRIPAVRSWLAVPSEVKQRLGRLR